MRHTDTHVHVQALANDSPPPIATLAELQGYTSVGRRKDFRFTDGIMYRLVDGNRCSHDCYNPNKCAELIESCLHAMSCGQRFIAALTVGERLHALTKDDSALTEKIAPHMIRACEYLAAQVRGLFPVSRFRRLC